MRPLTFSSQNIAQMIESIVIDPTDAQTVVSGQESTKKKTNLTLFLMASDLRELWNQGKTLLLPLNLLNSRMQLTAPQSVRWNVSSQIVSLVIPCSLKHQALEWTLAMSLTANKYPQNKKIYSNFKSPPSPQVFLTPAKKRSKRINGLIQ